MPAGVRGADVTEYDILNAVDQGEAQDWEFKSARGGVPGSLWETYSAMANTDGGTIVLGVAERDGVFQVEHLDKHAQYRKSILDTANNRGKVSWNLLSDADATPKSVLGKTVLVVRVPRATRRERPVFVGQNPLTGTYRRSYEGDYHCSPEQVGRMLADQAEEPADARILDRFILDDLDPASLGQYRNRFAARSPSHPWLALDTKGLLAKLGGWRRDRQSGREGLTVAGLLMFGRDEAIREPEALPQFHVDYRDKTAVEPGVRWEDRITVDGQWVANLFQFYRRVVVRLTADLRVPSRLEPDLFRKDDTPVGEAVREAPVNALIHAGYRGQGGVVIDRYRSRIEMSNPGTLLVSSEQLLRGAAGECRNKSPQLMFQMIGAGDKAGSGFDKIRRGRKSQNWWQPYLFESPGPDRGHPRPADG
jgi:ATP-dependent DNA helicase RecG